jgi:poly [ADP-ribose] polymerase
MRIAPPEAPASGYLFGKGIYLADLAEKSIGYCRANSNSKALILLIEVIVLLFRGR